MGAALAALIVLGGCADGAGTVGSTRTTDSVPSDSSAPHTVRLSEATAGQIVQVTRGDRLTLTLHNTYWRIDPPDGRVLTLSRAQQDSPAPAGTCLPGVGCGPCA